MSFGGLSHTQHAKGQALIMSVSSGMTLVNAAMTCHIIINLPLFVLNMLGAKVFCPSLSVYCSPSNITHMTVILQKPWSCHCIVYRNVFYEGALNSNDMDGVSQGSILGSPLFLAQLMLEMEHVIYHR